MTKRYGLTIRAIQPRLVLNCRFVQVVFRTLVVFYSKYKEYENEARKKCVFFFLILFWRTFINKKCHSGMNVFSSRVLFEFKNFDISYHPRR